MNLTQLQSKITNAKDLDFGTIFNQSMELFKKVWLQGLLMLIITGALIIPIYFLMYIPFVALGLMVPESFEPDNEQVFMIMFPFIIFMLFFMLFAMAISFAIRAAFFRICMQKDLNIVASDDYFFFLKKKYLKKTITLSLVVAGIGLLAFLLCVLPLIYAIIPMSYMAVVYAFNPELSVSDIVKTGFKLGNKKWFITFLLIIVAWILSTIVGFLMCFIGIYVTQQFIHLPFYQVYKEVIGFEDANEINQIGDKLEF